MQKPNTFRGFHRGVAHDGVGTRLAAGGALKEKSNVGDFRVCAFPKMLELKSTRSPSTGEGVLSKTSPNKLKNDAEGDTSCGGGKGDNEGDVTRLEVLEVELAPEKRRLCEEISDPKEDEREGDEGEGDATDASETAGVTPRWEMGFP